MSKWLLIILVGVVLSMAFTISTFFVSRYETVVFACVTPQVLGATPVSSSYKKISSGFPAAFYYKFAAPGNSDCQKPADKLPDFKYDAHGNLVNYSKLSNRDFIHDLAIWTAVTFAAIFVVFSLRMNNE
jgi:hypothetical protein